MKCVASMARLIVWKRLERDPIYAFQYICSMESILTRPGLILWPVKFQVCKMLSVDNHSPQLTRFWTILKATNLSRCLTSARTYTHACTLYRYKFNEIYVGLTFLKSCEKHLSTYLPSQEFIPLSCIASRSIILYTNISPIYHVSLTTHLFLSCK